MKNTKTLIYHVTFTALFVGLIAVGAMLSIPLGNIKFTLQLLAVLLAAGLLPVYDSTLAVGIYLILGAIGVPIFAGFTGGLGVLTGVTGGFLFGFLLTTLASGGLLLLLKKTKIPFFWQLCISFAAGVVMCYLCGWVFMYLNIPGKGVGYAAQVAILPYLIPDAVKLLVAALIVDRTKPYFDKLFSRRAEGKVSAEKD